MSSCYTSNKVLENSLVKKLKATAHIVNIDISEEIKMSWSIDTNDVDYISEEILDVE